MSPRGFKVAFLPPLVLTLSVNLILFSLSFYAATCGRKLISSSASGRDRFINQVSLSICGFFLLGFTWFFGMLAVGEVRLVFSYLFCIFNAFQGIFLFLLVRKHWVKTFADLTQRSVTSSNSRGTRGGDVPGGPRDL
ncbi:hypothetical protein Pcinc_040533 [Petrolisthes cinctipes]|uniref:G-protein coupled receptors family 2 profile 2 domain-containing protein n=1 Tax=Petrolisthes cinctipes TaxID=88211 RepID=A0AAE1BPF3_PETCI|nr:hypothetical protein Pcinc_040533 [Petrolisthes cinctipes]